MASSRLRIAFGALLLPVMPRQAPLHLDATQGAEYLRRCEALRLLGQGLPCEAVVRITGLARVTLVRLMDRALMPRPDGQPVGFAACLPAVLAADRMEPARRRRTRAPRHRLGPPLLVAARRPTPSLSRLDLARLAGRWSRRRLKDDPRDPVKEEPHA
jgi:hypothetical protein